MIIIMDFDKFLNAANISQGQAFKMQGAGTDRIYMFRDRWLWMYNDYADRWEHDILVTVNDLLGASLIPTDNPENKESKEKTVPEVEKESDKSMELSIKENWTNNFIPTGNIIPEIAAALGVDLEEDFHIEELVSYGYVYKFSAKQGLLAYNVKEKMWEPVPRMLSSLCLGELHAQRIPFSPKTNEYYYTSDFFVGATKFSIKREVWIGSSTDYARKKLGLIYRTAEECKDHAEDDYKKLTGREWVD